LVYVLASITIMSLCAILVYVSYYGTYLVLLELQLLRKKGFNMGVCSSYLKIDLEKLSMPELLKLLREHTEKIDGDENDERTTVSGSANLDLWMEIVEDIEKHICSRDKNITNT
jgi:hypothetical protein